jgi:hypothetical protein
VSFGALLKGANSVAKAWLSSASHWSQEGRELTWSHVISMPEKAGKTDKAGSDTT